MSGREAAFTQLYDPRPWTESQRFSSTIFTRNPRSRPWLRDWVTDRPRAAAHAFLSSDRQDLPAGTIA